MIGKNIVKNIKMVIWRIVNAPYYSFKYWQCRKLRKKINILDSEKTIEYIVSNRCSLSRYGDGELAMIYHLENGGDTSNFYINSFQDFNNKLAERLKEILLHSESPKHIVGIPYGIVSTKEYIGFERIFWERFVVLDIKRFVNFLNLDKLYLNSCFTRFYIGHKQKSKSHFSNYVLKLKSIWDKQNVCIVEGYESRLGVGNKLFDNAKSIQRILCPAVNAFYNYDSILQTIRKHSQYDVYLLALGHTATILAYDLSQMGLWAIDIGHVDIEYEWFLMGAKKKENIKHNYVNEIPEGRIVDKINNPIYESQIIAYVMEK